MAKCLCGPRAFFVMAHDCDTLSERMLSMKRTLLLLLAIALMAFTLPALAGDNATGSDAAATDGQCGYGVRRRHVFKRHGRFDKHRQGALQDDADSTGESGAAPTADAAPVTNSLFGSIIDSGKPSSPCH